MFKLDIKQGVVDGRGGVYSGAVELNDLYQVVGREHEDDQDWSSELRANLQHNGRLMTSQLLSKYLGLCSD